MSPSTHTHTFSMKYWRSFKSTTACITSLCGACEILLADFNLAVSTLTARPPNLIPHQIFQLYNIKLLTQYEAASLINTGHHFDSSCPK